MKRIFWLFLVCLIAVPAVAEELKTDKEKISYAIGMSIGSDMQRQELDLDVKLLADGLSAAYADQETLLSQEDMVKTLVAFQQKKQAELQAKAAEIGDKNKAAGQKFMGENATKEGVKTTASGLQYEVLTEGQGATPTADDKVTVNYRGTLVDGTEFDSSYKRGEPVSFPVNGVIAGWTEALQLMKEGDKFRLVIPENLAYGERGAGQLIGPGSTLVFEVELIKVEKKK
ncbi:MAG: FKBP-type peptidyl-prolyl cis-trans isomerase [Deltaproteobacteria bacterium]|nr:FKBP-type peptidyl-prolyl cis-trans isomerase [Deltaproteobacteria bacterium]NCP77949.1 FKBP-type peptidyl-prolyl cis-trans isomerase [Desulfuromonadales bacterium]